MPQKKFPKINFTCQNVCSLNISKPNKKTYSKLAAVVKNGSDVILLSDTRLNSDRQIAGVNDIEKRLKFFGYSIFHNSQINSRGTAILISNSLDYTVDNTFKDEDCNILLMKIVIKGEGVSVTIGSIYGPNHDNQIFFDTLKEKITMFNSDFVIVGVIGTLLMTLGQATITKMFLILSQYLVYVGLHGLANYAQNTI